MRKFLSFILFVILLGCLFLMPFLSSHISTASKEAIKIITEELIPSLFPFIFLSSLVTSWGSSLLSFIFAPLLCPLFKISKNAVPCIISGFLGGFPAGAKTASILYKEKKITKREAERLPLIANNAGFMFVVGVLGVGCFGSFNAGIVLYLFHIFPSVIMGLFTKGDAADSENKNTSAAPDFNFFPSVFAASLKDSVFTMGIIAGNFIIFSLLSSLLSLLFGESPLFPFAAGLIEVTGGVLSLPKTRTGLITASFLLSFNGLSVHMQSLSFFAPLKLSMKKCFSGKIFSAFLSALLMDLTLPQNFPVKGGLPPMFFYIFSFLIPLLFLIKKGGCKLHPPGISHHVKKILLGKA